MNETWTSKTGIITITFNLDPRVFLLQIAAIKKFCLDDYDILVVDNSSNEEMAMAIEHHANDQGVKYIRFRTGTADPSRSHCFAANLAHKRFMDMYNRLLFLDHDAIPVKPFSVEQMLSGRVAGGVLSGKNLNYFWPGCFVINEDKVDKSIVDFSPNNDLQLDTGGELRLLKDKYGDEGCVYFDEIGCQNPHQLTHKEYYFYMMIYHETFMHFLNTSNWRGLAKNEDRINSLLDIATEKIQQFDIQQSK